MYVPDWTVARTESEASNKVAMAEKRDSVMNLETLVDTLTSD